MPKAVVIVESPAKAKTLNKILGKGYAVKACYGHVRDLPKTRFGIDVENDFKPNYRLLSGKKKTVQELRKATGKVSEVYLAPDPDREGEAIAWHLIQALKLPASKVRRVTFNELTAKAVREAFKQPGVISMARVNAQQARRFLDRIVGYRLSPLLWKKVAKGLSAGRVQSVAVKLVVLREREIQAFKAEEYWKIAATLKTQAGDQLTAELKKWDGKDPALPNEEAARALVEELERAEFRVASVSRKEKTDAPKPPYITSLLQQAASTQLGFRTKRTMVIAQQLYEGVELGEEGAVGLISYMRTDSFRVADSAIQECREYVPERFGKEFLAAKPRRFPSRKGAQDAHEAIRPTSVLRTPESIKSYLTREQYRLYELIWKRFVATQMAPAVYLVADASIQAGKGLLQARGRELKFAGHTLLSGHSLRKDEQLLPALEVGELLQREELKPTQHFTQPPPRYTEASLVQVLEKNGIGRPSTYAPIISTIQDRGYVRQEQRKLFATELGILVTDKLQRFFEDIMDFDFTAQLEEKLDQIEEAHAEWVAVLKEFHELFVRDLERAEAEMASEKGQAPESEEKCEKCARPMVIRWTRTGKFLGCSGYPECDFTRSLEEEEKTDEVCENCGSPMVVRYGRHGKFLGCSGYPECKTTKSLKTQRGYRVGDVLEPACEQCGKPMKVRAGRRGLFVGCSGYPDCRNTRPLPKTPAEKADKTDEAKKSGTKEAPSTQAE